MNNIQRRLMETLKLLGGSATAETIRHRGNYPKTVAVIECNLRGLVRDGYLHNSDDTWSLNGFDAGSVKGQQTAIDVEDEVNHKQSTDDDQRSNVLDAVDRLKAKLQQKPTRHIEEFQLKHDTLMALAEITEDSIAEVLNGIVDDLAYLNSMDESTTDDDDAAF